MIDPKIYQHLNENNGHGPMYTFHGLGWDGAMTNKHRRKEEAEENEDDEYSGNLIKVYIMFHQYELLSKEYTKLVSASDSISPFCLQHGLLSFSYRAANVAETYQQIDASSNNMSDKSMALIETRVIMYPKDVNDAREAGLDVPAFTGTTALMFTSKNRGLVPLYDLERYIFILCLSSTNQYF
jgi:hypothetical protein